jgi:hypothetical protein
MAKLTRDEIKAALKKQAPAYEPAEAPPETDESPAAAPDTTVADREAMARKYAKGGARGDDVDPLDEDDTVLAPVEGRTDEGEVVRRAVVVSSKTHRIKAVQG